MRQLKIIIDNLELPAELLETPTAAKIWEALPFNGEANVWGEEIYFEVPVYAEQEPDACESVEVGDLAYWPVGAAFCIFFGPTPVSKGKKPRAYSPVNVFGSIKGDLAALKTIPPGTIIKVETI